MRVIIAGCGRLGSQLAMNLSYEGYNVVVIDRDPNSFQRLEMPFNGLTLAGVAFDEELLREAGIEEADAFLALTNYDNTNLMAAEIASDLFGVPRVIARVYNPDKELTYRSMGIDYLSGSAILAHAFHRQVTSRGVTLHHEAGNCRVVELEVSREAGGFRIRELRLHGALRIMSLFREERPVYFSRDTRVEAGDHLLLAVDTGDAGELLQSRLGRVVVESLAAGPGYREENREWRIVVAGCGRVGTQLSEMLSLDGYQVAVIDRDPSAYQRLSKSYQGEFHHGMAFDLDVLERAGIEEADAFAALTNYDNTNLMASEVARGIYGVEKVISRLFNPDKGQTYQALEINYICGTALLAEKLVQRIVPRRLRILSWVANNRVLLVEFNCPRRFRGKRVSHLEGEEIMRVGLLARDGEVTVATPETVLEEGDLLVAAILAPRLSKVRRMGEG